MEPFHHAAKYFFTRCGSVTAQIPLALLFF